MNSAEVTDFNMYTATYEEWKAMSNEPRIKVTREMQLAGLNAWLATEKAELGGMEFVAEIYRAMDAAAPATAPSEVERLAVEIADFYAKKIVIERCAIEDGWFDTGSGMYVQAVTYLELRGLLEHHPDHPEWVRVGEKS